MKRKALFTEQILMLYHPNFSTYTYNISKYSFDRKYVLILDVIILLSVKKKLTVNDSKKLFFSENKSIVSF